MSEFHEFMISKGQDPGIARYIEGSMVESGAYDKMRVDNCEVPLNPGPKTGKSV